MTDNENILRLHDEALVFDALSPRPYILGKEMFARLKQGGVDATQMTVAVSENFEQAVQKIDDVYVQAENNPEAVIATSIKEIEEAHRIGKMAIVLGFQDAVPLEGKLSYLRTFYRLGVRCIQLTFHGGNELGDGCAERRNCGLSFTGLEVVNEMNRLGMLIDLSHCGDATTMETISKSKDPVAFTHANARALCSHPRNKTDEQIVALARKGGVIGVTPHYLFVSDDGAPTLEKLLDHVDHIVRLVGVDHVGLGLDFIEGKEVLPHRRIWRARRPDIFGNFPDVPTNPFAEGLESISKLPNLTEGLAKRDYSEEDIRKILGGNFLRLFAEVCG
jgi:membrane dipeptidase